MAVINTNINALVAQNNLAKTQQALGTAIQRLSSGLRINSAKDDAAGQAIANRFTSNINGLTQAARNTNDGISIAQTAEGSLNEINENLQRIRTLTVQAANGSNSAKDLKSIQDEIHQRLEEINRISEHTQFNGKYVLGKDGGDINIQVGAHDGQFITIKFQEINTKTLNITDFNVSNAYADRGLKKVDDEFDTTGIDLTSLGDEAKIDSIHKDADGNMFIKVASADDAANNGYYAATLDTDTNVIAINDLAAGPDASLTPTGSNLNPLASIDRALDQVGELRSHLGAIQNRFESTINSINTTVVNLSAARSRIQDADYAVEVSNLIRAQILQQAAIAILAQANQQQQNILALLR